MSGTVEPKMVKVVLIGNTGCGKTCIVTRFVRNTYDENVKNTVGAAFSAKIVYTADGEPLKFQIWDTAGQERFKNLTKMYYQGSKAAVCVFAVDDADSFVGAKDWVKEMRSKATENAIIVLCGNKIDKADRAVSSEEAESFAAANDLLYIETSAKTGYHIEEVFELLTTNLPAAERKRLQKNLRLLQLQLKILNLEDKASTNQNASREMDALVLQRRELGGDMAVMDLSKDELVTEINSIRRALSRNDDDFDDDDDDDDSVVDLSSENVRTSNAVKRGCC